VSRRLKGPRGSIPVREVALTALELEPLIGLK
jgi:hypothetical protein